MQFFKSLSLIGALIALPAWLAAQNSQEWAVQFNYNTAELSDSARILLDQIAAFSKKQERYIFILPGHTDLEEGKI
ncbi:MAG: hypothetical protein AAFU64_10075 [Bacteroidota bacterium]